MTKAENLKDLYEDLELIYTDDRVLLSKVKNREASDEEINELFDNISFDPKGGKKLDDIKNFEKSLINDFNSDIITLEKMEDEYTDIAHLEDETEQEDENAKLKKRYKIVVKKIEETIEAMKIAYFQIDNYYTYEDRFDKAKEPLGHLE